MYTVCTLCVCVEMCTCGTVYGSNVMLTVCFHNSIVERNECFRCTMNRLYVEWTEDETVVS